jgi:peptide/nickel transport system substrate-binding protein
MSDANQKLDLMIEGVRKGRMNRRDFISRSTALGLSAGLAGALFGKVAHADEPKKGGTLRAGISGGESSNSLDPALAASPAPNNTCSNWGETLFNVNPDGSLNNRVAEEFTSSPDSTEWTFKIRSGVEFHNGQTLTAEDVAATFRRHTDEKSQSGAMGIVQGISEMKADGDKLVVKLNAGNVDLPYMLADYHLVIQPGGGVDNPAAGIGSGPYKIESFDPGVRVVFSKFANYFDASVGHADQVEIIVINDNTARTAALQAGQIHMMNRVDPKIADLLKGFANVEIKQVSGRGQFLFLMHCDTAPFDNNDLRMALKLAINRQELVDKVLGGLGSRGNDFPINAAYPLFDDTIPQREYDADEAAAYYAKSGHDRSPIILRTAQGAFPGAIDAANLFAASANAAGIPLQVQVEPDDGYWDNVWNVQPFCASYWNGRPVQDQMYTTAYLSTADWNDTNFDNARFDELLIAARAELDPATRKGMYSEMGQLVRDEGGVILPMFNDFVDGVRTEVGGWVADPNAEMMNGRALSRCWLA